LALALALSWRCPGGIRAGGLSSRPTAAQGTTKRGEEWHPLVAKCDIETEGNTTLRRLHLTGGGTILEKLEKSEEDGQSYSYSIVESPLPVKNYNATIKVSEAEGGGCSIEWSSDFEAQGAPENDAAKAIEGIYQAGFDNLRKMFGG
jgi:hypothetical protein